MVMCSVVQIRAPLNLFSIKLGIPSEHWNAVCLLVDKLDKVGVEVLVSDCTKLGVDAEVSQALFGAMKVC